MDDWSPIENLEVDSQPTAGPPALPGTPTPNDKRLIIPAYICTILTIIPLIGYLPGLIALILGIQMCRKNITLHGVINIISPLMIGFVMAPILLIAVLTMMKSNIQETFERITAELEAVNMTKAFPYEAADEYYARRRATPLADEEKKLIGNWSGENIDFQWEIMRKADGTYALAYNDEYGEDIVYGIWGIENGKFYYMDLEVIGYSPDSKPEKNFEDIELLTSEVLVTTYIDEDDKTVRSTEKRVESFRFKIWKDLDQNGRYPESLSDK